MTGQFALLSLVFMMSFVIQFDRVHYKRRLSHWLSGANLFKREELERIQAIWSACQE
jgi:hypothetical protein